jgi:hypothetical protein
MEINDTQLQKAFTILDNLSPGDILDLERIAEERRDLFVSCAEQYHKSYGTLELNPSRNKIKKYASFRNFSGGATTDRK